jgi:secreted trypsin-like serine protease
LETENQQGDSGAPLIFKQLDGTWKQIGIGSFISSQGCQAGSPTGYTRLSSYSTWVQQIIAPGSDFSTTPLMIRTTTTPIETTPTTTVTTTNSAPTQQGKIHSQKLFRNFYLLKFSK